MKRSDWTKPLRDTTRSPEELVADLSEGARALAATVECWNPEDVKRADVAAASATLLDLTRTVGQLRRRARA